ncbi:MAG: 5-oxoprolinase subunit PxpA [Halioglobus sp.]
MLLNCDMGESYGRLTVGDDAKIMPYIDQANIACGFHAGDPLTIQRTLELAALHGVQVGAHPAYPDLEEFGRRSMTLSPEELIAGMHYQIAALEGMAAICGTKIAHVKPHGALYNDAMRDAKIRNTVMAALASYHRPLPLVLQATPNAAKLQEEAKAHGITLSLEAFADRAYTANGLLQPRSEKNAVHDAKAMLAQVEQLVTQGSVNSVEGKEVSLQADTLCVHGDNSESIAAIAAIRTLLDRR